MSQATAKPEADHQPSTQPIGRSAKKFIARPEDASAETSFGIKVTSDAPVAATAADAEGVKAPAQRQAQRYVEDGKPRVPKMPRIGLPEKVYLQAAKEAEARGDDLTVEAAKVGQYVSLALRDLDAPWSTKLKYFRHALKRHARPPEHADDVTKQWFGKLAHHARAYAGAEALRLAAEQDDCFEARQSMGQSEDNIADDAESFFDAVCPHCDTCPPIYNPEDWEQLKSLRDRWV